MKKGYIIYKYTSPSGGVYIGQTSKTIEERAKKNGQQYLVKRKSGRFHQPGIANAIIKYGWDNFKKEILFEGLTKDEANAKEIEMIDKYRLEGLCYNIANGGDNLDGVNDHKVKQYDLNCNLIKQWDSILEACLGIGLKPSAEANISACCLGRKHRAYNFIWRYADDEAPTKKLIPYRQPICQFDENWNYIGTYKTLAEAMKITGVHENGIGNVIHGRAKKAGGYYWKFECDCDELLKNIINN